MGSELASHLDDIHPALDERGVDNGRMAGSALVEQSAVQVVELPREQVLVGTVDAIHGRAVERLDETAVVGLDMVLPRTYDDFDFDSIYRFEKLAALARDLGLIRFYYSDGSLPSELSKEEKELYRAIACKIAVNVDIINEGQAITDAVREIDSKPKPDVPMIMFVSDGTEVKGTDWIEKHYEYASDLTNAKVIELGCGHYVHNFKQEQISEKMKEFIGNIK